MNHKFFRTAFTVLVMAAFLLVTLGAATSSVLAQPAEDKFAGAIPRPVSPGSLTADNTPTFKWTRVENATQYRLKLYKGEGNALVYMKTIQARNCTSTFCSITPGYLLDSGKYRWQVQAYIDGGWKQYSYRKNFNIVVPVPIAPVGTITDTTPVFEWTKVEGALRYRLQIYKVGTPCVLYTKVVEATACGETNCLYELPEVLALGTYRWKVQSFIGEVWRPYSALKYFTVAAE